MPSRRKASLPFFCVSTSTLSTSTSLSNITTSLCHLRMTGNTLNRQTDSQTLSSCLRQSLYLSAVADSQWRVADQSSQLLPRLTRPHMSQQPLHTHTHTHTHTHMTLLSSLHELRWGQSSSTAKHSPWQNLTLSTVRTVT